MSEIDLLQSIAVRDVSGLLNIEQVEVEADQMPFRPMTVTIRGRIRVTPEFFEDPSQFDLFCRDATRVFTTLLEGIRGGPFRIWECPTFEITGETHRFTREPLFFRAEVTLVLYRP